MSNFLIEVCYIMHLLEKLYCKGDNFSLASHEPMTLYDADKSGRDGKVNKLKCHIWPRDHMRGGGEHMNRTALNRIISTLNTQGE
jgi:hypothetical protein